MKHTTVRNQTRSPKSWERWNMSFWLPFQVFFFFLFFFWFHFPATMLFQSEKGDAIQVYADLIKVDPSKMKPPTQFILRREAGSLFLGKSILSDLFEISHLTLLGKESPKATVTEHQMQLVSFEDLVLLHCKRNKLCSIYQQQALLHPFCLIIPMIKQQIITVQQVNGIISTMREVCYK